MSQMLGLKSCFMRVCNIYSVVTYSVVHKQNKGRYGLKKLPEAACYQQ